MPDALTGPQVMGICLLGGIGFAALMHGVMTFAAWIDGNTTTSTLYGAATELEEIRHKTEWERERLRELKDEIARREEEDKEGARPNPNPKHDK